MRAIEHAERETIDGETIHLRLAVDYSARDAILRAAANGPAAGLSREQFRDLLSEAIHENRTTPDVDLLIRTGREQRLSDFLLWESAYAELLFTDRLWPEFSGHDLRRAMEEFRGRNRRFGAVVSAGRHAGGAAVAGGI